MNAAIIPGEAAENSPQRDAEAWAVRAENVHKKVESFAARFAALGRQKLDAAIEAGQHLIKAKAILGHGKFKEEQNRWRNNKTVTFSERSGRRYMLVAKYADEIKMAKVATLQDAEKHASALTDAEKPTPAAPSEHDQPGSPTVLSSAPANSAGDLETQVLKTMRRFAEVDDQRAFLTSLIEKLNHRLQLLAS